MQGTLNGALIAGGTDNTGGISFGGNSTINTDPFSPTPTPEMPTIAMAAVACLLVLGGAGLRRVGRLRAA